MKTRAAVLSISFTVLIYMVISVAVSGMTASFPAVPESMLLLVLTLPNLTCIPAILATPLLLRRFSQKAVTLGSLALTLACGVCCLLLSAHLWVLLTCAVLMGFAYGISSTMFPLLVNTHFTGDERVTVMGYCTGMLQLGRLVTALIGGFLAERAWNYVYFTFIFILIALLIAWRWLPGQASGAGGAGQHSDTASLTCVRVWLLGGLSILFAIVYFLSATHASLYIEGGGLGTPAMTGAVSSMTFALSAAVSSLYGRLPRRVRAYVPVIVFLLMGTGYVLAGAVVSLPSIFLALAVSAASIALYNPWLMLRITVAAGREAAPVATAMVLSLINVGYFLSPYVNKALARLAGQEPARIFLTTGALSLALGLLLLLRALLPLPRGRQ